MASGRCVSQASPVLPGSNVERLSSIALRLFVRKQLRTAALQRVARTQCVCRRRRKPMPGRGITESGCSETTTHSLRLPAAARHRLRLCYPRCVERLSSTALRLLIRKRLKTAVPNWVARTKCVCRRRRKPMPGCGIAESRCTETTTAFTQAKISVTGRPLASGSGRFRLSWTSML